MATHPLIAPFVRSTRGLLLYREQLIETVMAVAGYTWKRAQRFSDELAASWPEAAARRAELVDAAAENGVARDDGEEVFGELRRAAALGMLGDRENAVFEELPRYWHAYFHVRHGALFRREAGPPCTLAGRARRSVSE